MLPEIEKIKGVPPGAVLGWALKKRRIGTSVFAKDIGEYAGVLTDVTKLRRGITPRLSIKLGQKLDVAEYYFMLLQAYYLVDRERKENVLNTQDTPDLSILRRQIFWDIDFDKLDFQRYKSYIIQRVFERGNKDEIQEIIRFYGKDECRKTIRQAKSLFYPAIDHAVKYLNIKESEFQCLKNLNGRPYRNPWRGS